jgi:drug/metabolite transporter (DMT)-like permease
MPVSVQLGLLLALCCAFVQILGFMFKQRGAASAPPVRWREPVRSSVALFANRWWTLGILVAMAGWGFHVAGLALAPISLVQSVIAGGLALLTVVADKLFGFAVTRREWIGVALTAAGLAILAATLGDTADSRHAAWDVATLVTYCGLLTGAAMACCATVQGDPPRAGPVLGVAAGLLWGASDVSIKALSGHLGDLGIGVLVHPLAPAILVLSLVGLVVSARSLQLGPVVPVIAITTATGNVVTIASGPIVFGEPLPDEPLALALRILAFLLVIGAAALTPPPGAGREDDAEAESAEAAVGARVAHETA